MGTPARYSDYLGVPDKGDMAQITTTINETDNTIQGSGADVPGNVSTRISLGSTQIQLF